MFESRNVVFERHPHLSRGYVLYQHQIADPSSYRRLTNHGTTSPHSIKLGWDWGSLVLSLLNQLQSFQWPLQMLKAGVLSLGDGTEHRQTPSFHRRR